MGVKDMRAEPLGMVLYQIVELMMQLIIIDFTAQNRATRQDIIQSHICDMRCTSRADITA